MERLFEHLLKQADEGQSSLRKEHVMASTLKKEASVEDLLVYPNNGSLNNMGGGGPTGGLPGGHRQEFGKNPRNARDARDSLNSLNSLNSNRR